MTRRTTISWPDEVVGEVEKIARRRSQTISETVRQIVTGYLQQERSISPFEALIGAIDDPNLQAADMDDVLRGLAADADDRDRR